MTTPFIGTPRKAFIIGGGTGTPGIGLGDRHYGQDDVTAALDKANICAVGIPPESAAPEWAIRVWQGGVWSATVKKTRFSPAAHENVRQFTWRVLETFKPDVVLCFPGGEAFTEVAMQVAGLMGIPVEFQRLNGNRWMTYPVLLRKEVCPT